MLYHPDLVEQIILNLPNYVFWKDTKSIYRGCNYNFSKLIGLASPDHIIGYTDHDLPWFKKEKTSDQEEDQKIFETGEPILAQKLEADIDGITRVYVLDKSPTYDKEGVITGVLGVLVDITEPEKQKTELQQSIQIQKAYVASLNERVTGQSFHEMSIEEYTDELSHYLQSIIALMPGNVYWLNKDCVLLGGNNNLAKLFGLKSPTELVGLTYDQMSSLAHWINGEGESFRQAEIEVMSTGIPRLNVEEPPVFINGEARYYMSNKVPLYNNKNEIIGVLGISIDVTDKKLSELALHKAKNAAEAANRAKTEFLANMSHDMKSPLAGIVTTAEVIAYDEASRERDRQFASIISASGRQLESFFTSCLDLSKMEMQEWTSNTVVFSIKKLMEDVHALFLPKAMSNHLSFQLEYDESLPKAVEGHRDSLYRVLLNLVGNAIKFTEQGSVVLRANKIRQTDDQQITVEFQIQDTGVGIPEDKHRVIFEKMQRLTPSYQNQVEGSGIGLYIVDQYVKRLCGDIQVKSKMGQGSTFTVSLPLTIIADATLVESIPPHSAPASKILGTEKKESTRKITATSATTKKEKTAPIAHVLLVEDTEIIQVVTQILLHDAGFSVDVAASGEEALEMFSPEKYDLIYMDIGLPVMTGYEATREIRAKEKALNAKTAIPIIALTGHGAVDVQTFCGEAGMQGVLSKPLSREQAEAVWKYFGEKSDSKVSGLTLLHDDPAPPANHEILEVAATIQMTGGKDIADSLITSFVHELETQVLPKIKTLILAHQQDELGFLLHQQLGSLAYVKAPRLEKKLADLQTLVHKGVDIDQGVYQDIEQEALSLIKLWVK